MHDLIAAEALFQIVVESLMHVFIVFVFVPGSISLPYVLALVVDPKFAIDCLGTSYAV
jgi:hypothetical protein